MSSRILFLILGSDLILPPPTPLAGGRSRRRGASRSAKSDLGNAQEKERRRPQRAIRMASDTRCGCEAEEKVCPRACFFNSEL